MKATTEQPTPRTPPIKLTVAFPSDLHAATVTLAKHNRRSFTGEVCAALDEHLLNNSRK